MFSLSILYLSFFPSDSKNACRIISLMKPSNVTNVADNTECMPPPQHFGRLGPRAAPATALKADRRGDHRCTAKGEHQTNAPRKILRGSNCDKEKHSPSSQKVMCKIQSKNPAITVQRSTGRRMDTNMSVTTFLIE